MKHDYYQTEDLRRRGDSVVALLDGRPWFGADVLRHRMWARKRLLQLTALQLRRAGQIHASNQIVESM